ncbi:MAG: hypothetical protein JXP36_00100 [Bacteroidales bacterium]|nr:hypothetical protein [Bacteroidales bacterium]
MAETILVKLHFLGYLDDKNKTMPEKFQNKYRIPSARLQNWDYGWAAAYFVTICTKNRECYFGDIIVETHCNASQYKMQLSEIGKIAQSEWLKTFSIRPDMNLTMGEYVVMPNHFHAIIGIGDNEYNTVVDTRNGFDNRNDVVERNDVETQCIASLPPTTTGAISVSSSKNNFAPQRKNLASIIRGFKTGVTINARNIHADFEWQPRYYDHIIRDNESYQRIRNYIINNPKNWEIDKLNKQ